MMLIISPFFTRLKNYYNNIYYNLHYKYTKIYNLHKSNSGYNIPFFNGIKGRNS